MPVVDEARAFITGSHRYGTPTDESDLDLVVLVDDYALGMLLAMCDPYPDKMTDGQAYAPIRFGVLNIIAVQDRDTFNAWRDGTEILAKGQPVSRDEAKAYLKERRKCAVSSK